LLECAVILEKRQHYSEVWIISITPTCENTV